ncbi:DUF4082 domain-containing protein [Actinosynnema sp. NPDC047251]|uniref:Putative secreted protein n=1 Tax=Saccharothrix espanaensis (strain ATCC 51144 / DSM 44229 / JCM 9112 / NBRC 15066 / NRRL 15764) TaxID=1179773 RepID=K0JWK1_SACES|nr:DUF4082 domain-containing protein [Saccharothrix espanaensis]CCH30431.1 putative secreted protein [Saccharothrix espanaensis DSM 44229]
MLRLPRLLAAVFAVILASSGTAYAQDHPTAGIHTPRDGSYAAVGESLLVIGGAVNGEAAGITAVEVSVDGGTTWQLAETVKERWRFQFTPTTAGDVTIVARAHTRSTVGNPSLPATVHVGATPGPLPRIHDATNTLSLPTFDQALDPDWEPVELGLKFQVDRPGTLTGVTIDRGPYTGPIETRVWTGSGELLADTLSGAPGIGREWVSFEPPVPVQPGQDYVVSYFSRWSSRYQASQDYFTGTILQAPFIVKPGAGVFHYEVHGGFPTDTWRNSNYWILPLFHE